MDYFFTDPIKRFATESSQLNFLKDIKHIIWDWNGTLVDDTRYCVNLINSILTRRSLPEMTVETYANTFDFPVVDYYRKVGFDFEKDSFETLSAEFIGGYDQTRHKLTLHDGAIDALNYFKNRKMPQCMLSACQTESLKQMLVEHEIEQYFKTVLGLDHHYADGKVHLGKTWLQSNHIDRKHVLFIGDTLHDLEVAREMGVHCILISAGHNSEERLVAAHTHVLKNLHKLIDLFETGTS